MTSRWLGWLGLVSAFLVGELSACGPVSLPLGDAPGGGAGQGAAGSGGNVQGVGGSTGIAGSSGGACLPIPCPAPGFDPSTCACRPPVTPGACEPLDPVTGAVSLAASAIVDAGRDTDGTVYVLTEDTEMQLFVGTDQALVEQFELGTGEGTNGGVQFWTFEYDDAQGMQVTVEVQSDSSGLRMGVAKGAISGKGFDVGSTGDVLEPILPAVAAAIPAQTTQTFHVEFVGVEADGVTTVVVTAPDHATSFDGFRIFIGSVGALVEQGSGTVTVGRGLSIPSMTQITFTSNGSPATLVYESGNGTLTIGADSEPLSGSENPVVPPGAVFICP